MFDFYFPWFAILFPIPFLFFRFWGSNKDSNSPPEVYFPAIQRLKKSFPTFNSSTNKTNRLFFILLSLIWTALVFALMQPEKVDRIHQENNHGYDLMLAVDISGSMQAVDFSTQTKVINRLDVVKEVVGKFAKERQGDRVGLITFGENAYLHVPLTLDTISVSKMLDDTVPGMAGNATAIGDAIGLGIKILRERPEESRVLVLLTDGEDNSSHIAPLEAAKLAKQYGIRIYTIGIGKNGQVPFPDQFGRYFMADVKMDEDLLKKIADMTDGQYYHATDQKMLQSVYEKINTLEKTESNQTVFLVREPFYFYPLSLAMLLLFILSILELARKRREYGL